MNYGALNTWMCFLAPGSGELGSDHQGRSENTSFSQETGRKIQYTSRIDDVPSLLRIVQDAQWFLAHHSFFSILIRTGKYVC